MTEARQGDLLEDLGELSDDAVRRIIHAAEPTIQEKFEMWLHLNPGIFPLFLDLALEMKRGGHEKGSIALIAEVARWHLLTGRATGDDFVINNSYRSRLARRLMEEEPELEGFFETRELQSP